jgi:hypothetical protein
MFKRFLFVGLILAFLAGTAGAQVTVTSTTLTTLATANQTYIVVTSGTGFTAGNMLFIDREAMQIVSVSGTTINVARGAFGTYATEHPAGAGVWTGLVSYFSMQDPQGGCSQAPVALPLINPLSGNIHTCAAGRWVPIRVGTNMAQGAAMPYTAAGAITIAPGVATVTGAGALAMTLAAPPAALDGLTLTIIAGSAHAHTVTYSTGFNGGGASLDVGTFGGAIGDNMIIVARGGTWYVIALRNVTLG